MGKLCKLSVLRPDERQTIVNNRYDELVQFTTFPLHNTNAILMDKGGVVSILEHSLFQRE